MRHASVAQWIERGPSNPEVAGSSPVGGATDPHRTSVTVLTPA